MICKYCRRDSVIYDPSLRRWECARCHLSSHHVETMVKQEASYDNLPVEDVVIEAILNDEGEPEGFVQKYIPDAEKVPELKVDVERARLIRWIHRDGIRKNRMMGNKWLEDNGFEVVDERVDRRGKRTYVWDKI